MASTSGSQHRCVFVGNIPYDATEEQLVQICEEVGPVVSFRLVLDKESGRPKGYGFCEYKDEETALSARRNLQGYEINGRQLRVDFAENDKGVDRNREHGRGGRGLTLGTEGHKTLSGSSFAGDAALHQPLGLPLAATAASLMAEALGGLQTSNLPQFGNGVPNIHGSGNDTLNAYLAKMTRQQLNEVMSDLKALATKNKAQARQLLQENPPLTKALFQAQLMLGIVTPQMMQEAGKQKTSSAVAKSSVHDNKQDLKHMAPHLGCVTANTEATIETFLRQSEAQEKNVMPNSVVIQHPSLPPKHVPSHSYWPPMPQNQISVHGTIPGIAGVNMHSDIQAPPLPTSGSSLSQVHPSPMHYSRSVETTRIGHEIQEILPSMQQSLFTSQFSSNQPLVLNGMKMLPKEVRTSGPSQDLTCASRISSQPSPLEFIKKNVHIGATTELLNHGSKRQRLEEGGFTHNFISGDSSVHGLSLAQPSDSGLSDGGLISNADRLQHPQKQLSQLSAEEEAALLQQLLSLTPEQLSSLPLEQQQQVLEVQRTLRLKPHI